MLIIAHRGASGLEPENTILAFRKALELGADMIELDVRVCKTGEVVVMHDSKVDRTTSGKGKLQNLTYSMLRKLDAGKGEKIPTLEESLRTIGKKAKILIEIKEKEAIIPTIDLVNKLAEKKIVKKEDIFLTSLYPRTLLRIKKLKSGISLFISIIAFPSLFLKLGYKLHVKIVSINRHLISKKLLKKAHSNGIKVFCWTINSPKAIYRTKRQNIDGIITNFPDRVKEILSSP